MRDFFGILGDVNAKLNDVTRSQIIRCAVFIALAQSISVQECAIRALGVLDKELKFEAITLKFLRKQS